MMFTSFSNSIRIARIVFFLLLFLRILIYFVKVTSFFLLFLLVFVLNFHSPLFYLLILSFNTETDEKMLFSCPNHGHR